MSLEPVMPQEELSADHPQAPFPYKTWERIIYSLFVVIMPIFAFWSTELFKPDWQTGRFEDYLILFLFPQASLLFFFLLAYSIICFVLFVSKPDRFSGSFIIRAGIYTGVLLSLQYSILTLIYTLDSFIYFVLPVWISPFIYLVIYRFAARKWTAAKVNYFLLIFIPIIFLITTLLIKADTPLLFLIVLTILSPFGSFVISLRSAIWLFKNHETKLTILRGAGLATWLGAYIVAWRFDILKMYELYVALPPTPPPDCYIATAAAKGHPRFVRSWDVIRSDGTKMRVNRQLQVLKCAELALLPIHPRLHKLLRTLYDTVGKRLARQIQNPLAADVAYLLLKPWEWLTGLLLKRIIPEIELISEKTYTT